VTRGKSLRSGRRRSTSREKSKQMPTLAIKPSVIAIWALVFINSVLIISSAHKLFKRSVDVQITPSKQTLTIEVQNGCGISGIANRISSNLSYLNYQVVGKGNADHWNYDHSILIDLTGDKDAAVERLRKDLGIDKEDLYLTKEQTGADVRLIIGKDYQSLKIYNALQ